uniref:Uncharacterized protein n=1 Tax=Anguilla anguilla TaxID=7936 RepID=A0A0E9UJ61_ANGAN
MVSSVLCSMATNVGQLDHTILRIEYRGTERFGTCKNG